MTQAQSDYTLSWTASSTKNKITIRCDREGETIFCDEINPQQAKQRSAFIAELAKRNCDPATVESELLTIASEIPPKEPPTTVSSEPEEIEPDAVHRPERLILPGVCGVSVPVLSAAVDGVSGRWLLYAKVDNERIRVPLSSVLRFGERQIYIDSMPNEPTVNDRGGWSSKSRRAWLIGEVNVDRAELFQTLLNTIDRYVEFPSNKRHGYLCLLVCWVVLTYGYHAWASVGYLLVNGPAGSGKSTLFSLLRELCFRSFPTDNISAAAIYRTLNSSGGTLLFDEAERLRDTKSPDIAEINSMLLAGYQRGRSATRLEKVGDGFKTVNYCVYGPKAIACINGVQSALQTRCIEISTQRAGNHSEKPKRVLESTDWGALRDRLHVFALELGDDWIHAASRRDVGESINGRDYELWQPILAIASVFESAGVDGLVDLLEAFALESIADSAELKTPESDEALLRVLADHRHENPTNSELLQWAKNLSGNQFEKYGPEGIQRRLRAYGLRTTKSGSRREYRISKDDLDEIASRYAIDLGG